MSDNNNETKQVELTEEEQKSQAQQVQLLLLHGDIMSQLMQFERFSFFIGANYEINLNEETNRFEVKEIPHSDVKQHLEAFYKAKHTEKSPIIQGLSVVEAQKYSKS